MEPLQFTDKTVHYTILLAPFQPMTKIELETQVDSNAECYLDIRNPIDKTLTATVTKVPDSKRQIALNFIKLDIPGKSSRTISVTWSPKEAGCWRDIVQLTDNRRIKYDIAITTTAKENKKKVKRNPLSRPLSVDSVSINTRSNKNTFLKVSANNQPPLNSNATRKKWNIPTYKCDDWNKENVPRKYDETKIYTVQEEDKIEDTNMYDKSKNALVVQEQYVNIWSDESVLPQTLLPLNVPQDIRRATYIKETKHSNNVLYEHFEETIENTPYHKDQAQSDFSVLIDELTLAPTKTITDTLETKKNSIEFASSLNLEAAFVVRDKTFDINSQISEISDVSSSKLDSNELPYLRNTKALEAKALESCELSFRDDVNNLIASSPIQVHYKDIPQEERFKHLVDNVNCSITSDYEYFSYEVIPEDIKAAKKAGNLYIEISPPPRKLLYKHKSLSKSKISCTKTGKIVKDKISSEERSAKKLKLIVPDTKKSIQINAPVIKISKQSLDILSKVNSSLMYKKSNSKIQNEESSIYEVFEMDPLAPSTTENPFFRNTIITNYNERWWLRQEITFKKWLNALLSTPEDLHVDIDNEIANTAKVWQRSQSRKDNEESGVKLSTKEIVSNRLNALRKAACAMLQREEVMAVKLRITKCVVEEMLYIRSDRNLHRNLSLQTDILSLFLCYNPLWLRIGLEAIYDENIPLRDNNDLIGLTRFLQKRFFTNPRLTQMSGYHKTNPSKKFVTLLNQFMLKKFLFLVYFLDYAKQHKLIGHDPCLFHKQALYKTSREILLCFSRDLLSNIGDVTKVLRAYDYTVSYRQTYIDEYDYMVTNIQRDLRDGVRLCRVTELMIGVSGLPRQCRVPAISRLQKIHNVDLALNMLRQTGHILTEDIDAKSIVEGHREKTLSLLWQIVHKVQTPKFDRAVRKIQRWWRSQMWYIRVRNFLYKYRNQAAMERCEFLRAKRAAICLQRWWISVRGTECIEILHKRKNKRQVAIITLQRRWKATLLMRKERDRYRNLKNAALLIQSRWRAKQLSRAGYRRRIAVLTIERWWIGVNVRIKYLRLRRTVIFTQRMWRKCQACKQQKLNACLKIQTWWRTVTCSRRYKYQKICCVKLQRRCRYYIKRRQAVLLIQLWYLNIKSGRIIRLRYLQLKDAAIRIQNRWRARKIAYEEREKYQRLRESTIILQIHWRRYTLLRRDRQQFLSTKKACITLQSWWRMCRIRKIYTQYRSYILIIQRRWRAKEAGRAIRKEYQKTRACVILVQAHWKGFVARKRFLVYRQAVIVIQSYYRMKIAAHWYKNARRAAITIQLYWRRYQLRRKRAEEELLAHEDLASIVAKIQYEYGEPAIQTDRKLMNHIISDSDFWQNKINVLRTCNSVGMLLTCLSSLDTITKLSPTVCVVLCKLNLVDEIYKTISQRNRSQPWMHVCQLACSILVTLAEHSYTRKYIIKQEYLLPLVKLLSDSLKEKKVFLHCATLIWLLSQDENCSKAMMKCSDINWLLKNIQQKILKRDMSMVKLKKLEKHKPDWKNSHLFTNMSVAITTIIESCIQD